MILFSLTLKLGRSHFLALTEDFQVFGWGLNGFGELELGGTKERKSPGKLKLPSILERGPISIHCGIHNSWILKGDWRPERYSRLPLIEYLNDFEI